ncbi:MAG TPA: hypothetical protein VMA32_09820 [Streptosporangiaceae bacterium]|nr:hypothetical protein [Streptosporangiaceae bacterium]
MKRIGIIGAAAALAAGLSIAVPGALALAAGSAATTRATTALPVMTITMNGKTITVSGALQSGAVEVVSKVTKEPQGDPTLIRLDPGVTESQLLAAASGDPNNIALIASIVFSPQANKGTSKAQAYLQPGNYVAADLASSAQIPPLTTFVVAASSAPAKLPKPKAAMYSIEFGFRGPGTLHDGQLVRFGNHGYLVHMMVAIRAHSKAGAKQIARLLLEGKQGKAQKLATAEYSFFNVLTHNQSEQQVVSNQPGYWVLACFMNTQDGRDHTQLGMERVIRIVK